MKKTIAIGLIGLTALTGAALAFDAGQSGTGLNTKDGCTMCGFSVSSMHDKTGNGLGRNTGGMSGFGGMHMMDELIDDYPEIAAPLETGDYEEFKSLLEEENPQAASILSEYRFDRMQEHFEMQKVRQDAIENEDYDAFLDTLPEGAQMTEDEFADWIEIHNARVAIDDAIENLDYDAWSNAVTLLPDGDMLKEIVDEEDFTTFAQLRGERSGLGLSGMPGLPNHRGGGRMHGQI